MNSRTRELVAALREDLGVSAPSAAQPAPPLPRVEPPQVRGGLPRPRCGDPEAIR